tara:strand:- start:416 stop:619 length:204 start_codon:yes stop_codon:yes gene_type:complete
MSKDYDLVMVEETETHIFWEYTDGKPQMNLTLWQKTLQAKEAAENICLRCGLLYGNCKCPAAKGASE